MLCLSGFELYSRWVPLISLNNVNKLANSHMLTTSDAGVSHFHGTSGS